MLSGPGENYYPTDTLAQGDVVEVYRENSNGWLGIRPPEDSFSWVFARHVKRLDNGLAEVEKDDVPSRIGSRVSDQRNAVQIRLKKGEVVEIIGEQSIDGETWYKIAPPAGEFRWIQSQHFAQPDQAPRTEPSTDEPQPAEQSLPPIVTVAATTESAAPGATPVVQATESQPAAQQQEWRAAPADAMSTDVATPPLATDSAESKPPTPASDTAAATTSQPSPANAPSPPPTAPLGDELARRLIGVELQLSRIVAEPPATWQIDPLAREVEQLLAQAKTADERNAVQSTLAKIDRFAAIGRRYRGAPTSTVAAPAGQLPITPIGQAPIAPIPDAGHLTPDTSNYDAVGILRPVVSKRTGAPQFALLNERGQVVSFVTPSPDVNLQPYVGHRIGVTGSRGYIPEFQRAHVTAGRVAPLGERLLR